MGKLQLADAVLANAKSPWNCMSSRMTAVNHVDNLIEMIGVATFLT